MGFAKTLYNWTGFVPDNANSLNDAKLSLQCCEENGVEDFLVTVWSDSGRDGSIFSVLPSLYAYSEIYYHRATSIADVDKAKFKKTVGIGFDEFMLVDKLNKPYDDREYKSVNNKTFLYLYNDPFIGLLDSFVSDGIHERFKVITARLKKIKGREYQYIFDTLIALSDVLEIKSELGKRIRVSYENKDKKELKKIQFLMTYG